jgi:hypothetical protein
LTRGIGRVKFLAKDAKDAKGVADVMAVAEGPGEERRDEPSGETGVGMCKSFIGGKGGDGVRGGGGGWPSESAHASRAAFSSTLSKGSNSCRISTFAISSLGVEASFLTSSNDR